MIEVYLIGCLISFIFICTIFFHEWWNGHDANFMELISIVGVLTLISWIGTVITFSEVLGIIFKDFTLKIKAFTIKGRQKK